MSNLDDMINQIIDGGDNDSADVINEEATNNKTNDSDKATTNESGKASTNNETTTNETNDVLATNETDKDQEISKSHDDVDGDENLLISFEDNGKWDWHHFNRRQKNIIQYALTHSTLHIPYLVYEEVMNRTNAHKNAAVKQETNMYFFYNGNQNRQALYVYSFNEQSSQLHRVYNRDDYKFLHDGEYYDLGVMVNNILSSGDLLYLNNISRAELRCEIESKRTLKKMEGNSESTENKTGFLQISDVDYVLSKIHNPPVSYRPTSLDDIKTRNELLTFAPMIAYVLTHGIFDFYAKRNKGVKYEKHLSFTAKEGYKVVSVPKELQYQFNKTHKYFEDLKKLLTFDEESGFYVYTLDGVKLPILCLHEYMILSGHPLSEVSIKCYSDGHCKYCGAEMNAYHEVAKQELPMKVYDLIYKFMNCLNENIDQSLMMFAIFDLIYNSIKKNVDKANPNNYDESVVAYSALYLYALYLATKHEISYSTVKVNRYLDSAKKYWTEIGWSMRTVEEGVNSSMFNDLRENQNAVHILKQFIYSNEIPFLDILPLSVLFDAVVNPKDIPKPSTDTQKLFSSNKMEEFNEMISKAILKLWTVETTKPIIHDYPKITINTTIANIDTVKADRGKKFFKECCDKWCPANISHEFKNGSCVHCSLKHDKSNMNDVYSKYAEAINNSFLQEPHLLPSEKLILPPVHSISSIEPLKPEQIYDKYLKIDQYVIKQAIDKALTALNEFDELKGLIVSITNFKPDDIKKETNFIKQCLCYIISSGIMSSDQLLIELENIFFKIENIEWLTI